MLVKINTLNLGIRTKGTGQEYSKFKIFNLNNCFVFCILVIVICLLFGILDLVLLKLKILLISCFSGFVAELTR